MIRRVWFLASLALVLAFGPSTVNTITIAGTTTKYESGTILSVKADADNSTDVALGGAYSGGTPTSVDCSRNGGAYGALSSQTIAAGTWSGTLAAQAAGEGTLTCRWANSTSTTASTFLDIGARVLVIGDSTSAGQNLTNQLGAVGPPKTRWLFQDTTWVESDGLGTAGAWSLMGNQLVAATSAPVGILNYGVSGTRFASWLGSSPYFDAAIAGITSSTLTDVTAVAVQLGTNDTFDAISRATTAANVAGLVAKLWAAIPSHPPVFFALFGDLAGTGPTRADIDAVRFGILDGIAATTGAYLGANFTDMNYVGDHVHPVDANAAAIGLRWGAVATNAIANTTLGRGPRVSTITQNAAKNTFVFTWDRTLGNSVSSNVSGFRVLDGSTPLTITSAFVSSSTQTTVVTSASASGTVTAGFASGTDASGQTVPTTATLTFPDGSTGTLPAEPFLGHAVIDASTALFLSLRIR